MNKIVIRDNWREKESEHETERVGRRGEKGGVGGWGIRVRISPTVSYVSSSTFSSSFFSSNYSFILSFSSHSSSIFSFLLFIRHTSSPGTWSFIFYTFWFISRIHEEKHGMGEQFFIFLKTQNSVVPSIILTLSFLLILGLVFFSYLFFLSFFLPLISSNHYLSKCNNSLNNSNRKESQQSQTRGLESKTHLFIPQLFVNIAR